MLPLCDRMNRPKAWGDCSSRTEGAYKRVLAPPAPVHTELLWERRKGHVLCQCGILGKVLCELWTTLALVIAAHRPIREHRDRCVSVRNSTKLTLEQSRVCGRHMCPRLYSAHKWNSHTSAQHIAYAHAWQTHSHKDKLPKEFHEADGLAVIYVDCLVRPHFKDTN
jgi:hypothetical protein